MLMLFHLDLVQGLHILFPSETKLRRTTAVDNNWQPVEHGQDQREDPDIGKIMDWKDVDHRPNWEEISKFSSTLKSF